MKTLLNTFTIVTLALFFNSCASSPPKKAEPEKKTSVKKESVAISSNASLAKQILKHPKIILRRNQVSGRSDGASSYDSISQVSRGYRAKRSSYGNAKGGYTTLDKGMLEAMLYLANVKGYSYRVSSIAGGSHSPNSRHNAGLAFDVNYINGVKVNSSNPYYKEFMRVARAKGATEVLGPGYKGHSGHVHMAWPR